MNRATCETEKEVVQDSDQSDNSVQVSYSKEIDQQVEVLVEHNQAMSDLIKNRSRKSDGHNNKADSEQFDCDVDSILNTSLVGGIDKKMEAMATIM